MRTLTTSLYADVGARQEIDLPNGGTTTYAYDALNRLTNLTQKATGNLLLAKYDYQLHVTGRRTNAVEAIRQPDNATYATTTNTWTYDGMYRLTQEARMTAGTTTTDSYGYDPVGNRLTKTGAASIQYSYNANDQLTNEVSNVNGTTRYTYDGNGSLTSKTNLTAHTGYIYSYDARNRLNGVTVGGITTRYVYNHDVVNQWGQLSTRHI